MSNQSTDDKSPIEKDTGPFEGSAEAGPHTPSPNTALSKELATSSIEGGGNKAYKTIIVKMVDKSVNTDIVIPTTKVVGTNTDATLVYQSFVQKTVGINTRKTIEEAIYEEGPVSIYEGTTTENIAQSKREEVEIPKKVEVTTEEVLQGIVGEKCTERAEPKETPSGTQKARLDQETKECSTDKSLETSKQEVSVSSIEKKQKEGSISCATKNLTEGKEEVGSSKGEEMAAGKDHGHKKTQTLEKDETKDIWSKPSTSKSTSTETDEEFDESYYYEGGCDDVDDDEDEGLKVKQEKNEQEEAAEEEDLEDDEEDDQDDEEKEAEEESSDSSSDAFDKLQIHYPMNGIDYTKEELEQRFDELIAAYKISIEQKARRQARGKPPRGDGGYIDRALREGVDMVEGGGDIELEAGTSGRTKTSTRGYEFCSLSSEEDEDLPDLSRKEEADTTDESDIETQESQENVEHKETEIPSTLQTSAEEQTGSSMPNTSVEEQSSVLDTSVDSTPKAEKEHQPECEQYKKDTSKGAIKKTLSRKQRRALNRKEKKKQGKGANDGTSKEGKTERRSRSQDLKRQKSTERRSSKSRERDPCGCKTTVPMEEKVPKRSSHHESAASPTPTIQTKLKKLKKPRKSQQQQQQQQEQEQEEEEQRRQQLLQQVPETPQQPQPLNILGERMPAPLRDTERNPRRLPRLAADGFDNLRIRGMQPLFMNDIDREICYDFLNRVIAAVRAGKMDVAKDLVKDRLNAQYVSLTSAELIRVPLLFLHTVHKINNPSMYRESKILLKIIAHIAEPDDLIVRFEDHLNDNDVDKFLGLLKPLKIVLQRVSYKKNMFFHWIVHSICSFIRRLPTPDYSEGVKINKSKTATLICSIYFDLLPFFDPFIEQYHKAVLLEDSLVKNILMQAQVRLLGAPFGYLNFDEGGYQVTKPRRLAMRIVDNLLQMHIDVYNFLNFHSSVESRRNLCDLSMAVLFYFAFVEGKCTKAPKIYNPVYIFQHVIAFVVAFLKLQNQSSVQRALSLAEHFMRFVRTSSIPHCYLDIVEHATFCKLIMKQMVYNPTEAIRHKSRDIFDKYLNLFDIKGRYLIIYHLILDDEIEFHANGYVVTKYKNMFAKEMETNEKNMGEYFSGYKLFNMVKVMTHIQGPYMDIHTMNQQILNVVNFLRYVIIRDVGNNSGIWSYMKRIEKGFIVKLREQIATAKEVYNMRIFQLKQPNFKEDPEVNIMVDRRSLMGLPKDNQISLLKKVLVNFDMISHVVNKLEEDINSRKHKFV